MGGKSVSRGRAFRPGSCPGEKESTSCRLPLRGLSTPSHRRTGAPGRAAGHRGPHSVKSKALLCYCSGFSEKYAQEARCSTRGPSAAAGGWRNSPQGGRHGCRSVWRQGRRPCRQTPQPTRGLAGQEARQARKRGVVFSWLLLFWTSKREVTRPPQEDESFLLRMQKQQARASPASGLLR